MLQVEKISLRQVRENYINSDVIKNYYQLIKQNIGEITFEKYVDDYLMIFYRDSLTKRYNGYAERKSSLETISNINRIMKYI